MPYRLFILAALSIVSLAAKAIDDGGGLWLPQDTGGSAQITCTRQSPTIAIAVNELQQAWRGQPVELQVRRGSTREKDGYRLSVTEEKITVTSSSDAGLLYAAYELLRRQAMAEPVSDGESDPCVPLRLLNHWDNLDGTIERGYAGRSLWEWDVLPDSVNGRYATYARANASIGINGTVLNNVNASPQILSSEYIRKVKAIADVFRPYNIKVYLSVNFASPMALDGLPTADPADKAVVRWWQDKMKEIYRLIPDFGGLVVKANSEGQPGPCDYGRTHAEGANMIADALRPYGGILFWRAFVYSPTDADRAKQAYIEFRPLDGQFRKNVIIQVKNGPVDFQPREPYSPLFSAVSGTALAAELQITQEYLGHSNHVVYLAPMWKEFFRFVAPEELSAVAGVANTGTDDNWCGNTLAQSNWYAFGRLAWDASLTEEAILNEWTMQTFGRGKEIVDEGSFAKIMLNSREAVVNYMMPLGLHGLFAWGHHYGPEPWGYIEGVREDWLPRYYHRVDSAGLGFDRSATGTNAVAQYPDSLARLYDNIDTCPEEYLMWFHHVAWTHRMNSGRTMWDELCLDYQKGIEQVRAFQALWDKVSPFVSPEQDQEVRTMLMTQVRDAVWWKDACLLYFGQFSRLPLPDGVERPIHSLDALEQLVLPITNFERPSPALLNSLR